MEWLLLIWKYLVENMHGSLVGIACLLLHNSFKILGPILKSDLSAKFSGVGTWGLDRLDPFKGCFSVFWTEREFLRGSQTQRKPHMHQLQTFWSSIAHNTYRMSLCDPTFVLFLSDESITTKRRVFLAKQGSGRLIMTAEIAILEGRMEMFVPFLPLELSCFLLALIGDVLACLAFIFAFVSSHSQCMKIVPKSLI